MNITRKRAITGVAVLLAAAPLAALLVAQSGFYNVAATTGHTAVVDWFLKLGMTRSVAFHSSNKPVPVDLEDPQLIVLGAAHFQGGCAPCHGGPGKPINPIFEHMLPSPPSLAEKVDHWQTNELFWIVQNGLKYTGMPSWSGADRPDEIWPVVAFLKALPDMPVEDYRKMATGNQKARTVAVDELANEGAAKLARTACDRCHDTPDSPPISNRVPMLAGQSVEYLTRALIEYRDGTRSSGIMQPVAAELEDKQVAGLAEYYAVMETSKQLLSPSSERHSATTINRSSADNENVLSLVYSGSRKERIPACIACHGEGNRSEYPKLGGQNAEYLKQQLQLWKRGARSETAWGSVMAAAASNLKEQDIEALADWFSGQAMPEETQP